MTIRMLEKIDCLGDFVSSLPPHLLERIRFFPSRKVASVNEPPTVGDSGCRLGPVVYWTHHALRTDENAALDTACLIARSLNTTLVVYQGLSENYRFASDRHHSFTLQGAQDLESQYERLGIK